MSEVRLFYFDELDSTNSYARREFAQLPDGALVVAGRQSAGRGRLGRHWHSEPGGIYASLVMKSCLDAFTATMVMSLGALELLRATAPAVEVWLKWPNDLYVGDRKLAGVLSETYLESGNRLAGVIAGIGINVNLAAEALRRIDLPAASLLEENKGASDLQFPVKKMILRLVEILNRRYIILQNRAAEVFDEWRQANRLVGCEVEVAAPDGAVRRGRVLDITPGGLLVFAAAGGGVSELCAGDVRICRSSLARVADGLK